MVYAENVKFNTRYKIETELEWMQFGKNGTPCREDHYVNEILEEILQLCSMIGWLFSVMSRYHWLVDCSVWRHVTIYYSVWRHVSTDWLII